MNRFTLRSLKIQLMARGLYPRTLLGKYVMSAAGVTLLSWLVRRVWMWADPNSDPLWLWMLLLWATLGFLAFLFAVRWVRQELMWRLRNRLIVTYVFIGVIPVMLLIAMAGVAGYIFARQFTSYIASSHLNLHLERLSAANVTLRDEVVSAARAGRLPEHARELITTSPSDPEFPGREAVVWYRGTGYWLKGPGDGSPTPLPSYAQDGFREVIFDGGRMYLRAVSRIGTGKDEVAILSSLPLSQQLVTKVASELGRISIYPPDAPMMLGQQIAQQGAAAERSRIIIAGGEARNTSITVDHGQRGVVAAGQVSSPAGVLDWELPLPMLLPLRTWTDGKSEYALLVVHARISQLYRFFQSLNKDASIWVSVLVGIGVVLALIELVALIIGIRLSRTMTRSVADLYEATQHVNRGSFHHRIKIRSRDQLAALEGAFNSMTESIEKLIIEQKEKQKLESELAIAQEVQALLFPRETKHLESLELHGVCRPARTVSGDYYDFLPLGPDQMGIAVGDISGKGISAALLMATVHAFVRAYTLEEALTEARVGAAVGGTLTLEHPGEHLPPASLLALLNAQLFRSTPDSKYATMFLGFFHGPTRRFTYSNAGHLPPFIVSRDGRARKLGNGGMVVGLFGGVTYDNETVDLEPGDILVAYSDGVTEPESEFGEFGEERLLQIVSENASQPLPRIADAVTTAVTDWIGGGEQPDDITIVLARAR